MVTSLYPAVTVLLAATVLRERIHGTPRALGLACCCGLAVALVRGRLAQLADQLGAARGRLGAQVRRSWAPPCRRRASPAPQSDDARLDAVYRSVISTLTRTDDGSARQSHGTSA